MDLVLELEVLDKPLQVGGLVGGQGALEAEALIQGSPKETAQAANEAGLGGQVVNSVQSGNEVCLAEEARVFFSSHFIESLHGL